MGLKLTIYSNIEAYNSEGTAYNPQEFARIDLSYDGGSAKEKVVPIKVGTTVEEYKFSLVNMSFNKQMYQPGEIYARMQIAKKGSAPSQSDKAYYLFAQKDLNDYLRGCRVTLDEDTTSKTVADNYFIYELIPEYTSESLYIDLKIFSPDKLLTLGCFCQSWVARRLSNDILTDQLTKYTLPYKAFKAGTNTSDEKPTWMENTSDKTTTLSANNQVKNQLKSSDDAGEYIHPYLVQYNESFYDMLRRTANRWGEFLYFNNSKLVVGHDIPSTATQISSYVSLSYYNNQYADPISVGLNQRNTEYPYTLNGDSGALYKDNVTRDDYMTPITKSNFIKAKGDMFSEVPDDAYCHKLFQSLLTMKGNVMDWLTDRVTKDMIIASQNKVYLDSQKKKYNRWYFPDFNKDRKGNGLGDNAKVREKVQYDKSSSDRTIYCQFGTYSKGLRASDYASVLQNEILAGKSMICLDLGTSYQDLHLGNTIKFSTATGAPTYVVVQVTCNSEEYIDDSNPLQPVTSSRLHYHVYAIKETKAGVYYPAMLPTGHIRFSGPQAAVVVDDFDPMMNARYRIKYTWQSKTEEASPWLPVVHEMLWNKSGSVWRIKRKSEVLLNYEDGNIERPYIVGVLQNNLDKASRAAMFNTMSLNTPGGHAINLTDGYGAGTANFLSNFLPIVDLVKGFMPEASGFYAAMYKKPSTNADPNAAYYGDDEFEPGRDNKDPFYEGGIELKDKYGIYCIKASTDERNISISSPYGDVRLNAFTGITISAPNGDVKIQGKNVSIEAGNNLNIVSGKNALSGFLGRGLKFGHVDKTEVGEDAGYTLGSRALNLVDLSMFRHVVEVFLRPIEGTLTVKSNRYLKLEAGKGSAGIPFDGYTSVSVEARKVYNTLVIANREAKSIIDQFKERYKQCYAEQKTYNDYYAVQGGHCNNLNTLLNAILRNMNTSLTADDMNFDNNLKTDNAALDAATAAQQAALSAELDVEARNAAIQSIRDNEKTEREVIRSEYIGKAEFLRESIKDLSDYITVTIAGYNNTESTRLYNIALNNAVRAIGTTVLADTDNIVHKVQTHAEFINLITSHYDDFDFAKWGKKIKAVLMHRLLEIFKSAGRITVQDNTGATLTATADDAVGKTAAWKKYIENVKVVNGDGYTGLLQGTSGGPEKKLENQAKALNIFSNVRDDRVWGGDHEASILFSHDDKTYKLGQPITQEVTDAHGVSYYSEPADGNLAKSVKELLKPLI